ncbi:MAG: hypothetical protein ACFFB5_18845 [Promethearchaeota archaeon]
MAKTTPQRECQNQVVDKKNASLFFCLVIKEFLFDCPIRCPYFIQGTPISMEHIYKNSYEFECPHLHLVAKITSQDEQWFVCGKTGKEPNSKNCL